MAAIRAAQLGLSVAIVEAQYWGGVCLNVGCIPSKALLRNAEIAHLLRVDAGKFGIEGTTTMRYDAAFDRSRQVAVERVRGLRFLMRKNNIDEHEGQGTFVDRHTMHIKGEDIDTQINFGAVIIATGATPRLLPGTSRGPRVRTYEDQIMSRELPSSIAIIGAGPIGIEFAYLLANYGVAVTVIEGLQRVLPNEDVDVSKEIAKAYRNLGVTLLVGARIEGLVESADAVTVTYHRPGAADTDTLTVDVVLQAIGFAPNTTGYGLEKLGVATAPHTGGIVINDTMETTVPGVYGHRRRHRQADARPCGRGAGHHRGRNHRRRTNSGGDRLHDDAALNVLPTPSRQFRPDRGPGPRRCRCARQRHRGGQVPLSRQRKSPRLR